MTNQPDIDLFGVTVSEPMTTFTDLIVSVVCFYAFAQLGKRTSEEVKSKNRFYTFIRWFFLLMGIATTIGGLIGHAFLPYLSFEWKLPGWLISMVSVALIERAAIEYAKPLIKPKVSTFFKWLNIVELTTFIFISFYTLKFIFVEAHTAYGFLVVVSSFSIFIYSKTKSRGSLFWLYAVGVSAIAATTFTAKIGFHKWFNHVDVSHVLMATTAWLFYRGARIILTEELVRSS